MIIKPYKTVGKHQKVAVVNSGRASELSNIITRFIENRDIIGIEYQATMNDNGAALYTAMIVYEE